MPDNQSHPVDALLPTIRAALMRAYDHGAADAVQKLVAQIAPQVPRRTAYGSQRASILSALQQGHDTARKIAAHTNIKQYRVAQELAAFTKDGRVVRLEVGRYAPAVQS